MATRTIAEPLLDAEARLEGFDNLMPFKVQNILLVSSLYDSFILREDGRLNELLIDESLELNLQQIPGITHVSSCAEAVDMAHPWPSKRISLILSPASFRRTVRRSPHMGLKPSTLASAGSNPPKLRG